MLYAGSSQNTTAALSQSDRGYADSFACDLVARVRATPFLDHPPPERWLSREMSALSHGDHPNDDP
jgi:hypothetical protein